jgi:hypothetical protein
MESHTKVYEDPPPPGSLHAALKFKGSRLENPQTEDPSHALICKFSEARETFSSPVTEQSYNILRTMSCRTDNYIYLICSKKCEKQYVGETSNM